MNLLFLITRRQTRGAETFAVQLAEELAARGHQLWIASLYGPPPTPLRIPTSMEWTDLSDEGPRAIPRPSILRRIAELVRKEGIDLVQANASDNLKYAVLSRRLYGWRAPVVYRNASIMSVWTRGRLHTRLYAGLLDTADAIASVSDRSRDDIVSHFGIAPGKVHRLGIAAHAPDGTPRAAARQRLSALAGRPLPSEARLIFHVGAFTPEKNHAGLLRIFRRIAGSYAGPVYLVSIGSGPGEADVHDAAADLDHVLWLGYRNDVPGLLPAADLLLLPSLIEGTPGAVLEAGAHGIPALAYRVGAVDECLPEQCWHELAIPPGEEATMADHAVALLTDDARRERVGEDLRTFVAEHYAFDRVARQFEELFEALLPPKPVPRAD